MGLFACNGGFEIMKRLGGFANYFLTFLVLLGLNFLLPRLMPGDPLSAIYGVEALVNMTPDLRKELTRRFALDKPIWVQFLVYLKSLAQGDLGYSYYYKAPVLDVILGTLSWTLLLVGSSLLLSTFGGIFLGIESGWRHRQRVDKSFLILFLLLNGFPNFFIGLLLLLFFGVTLSLFPLQGAITPYSGLEGVALLWDLLHHLFLPLVALTIAQLPNTYFLMRNSMLATVQAPYILTAKGKGLSDRIVRYRHAGRNALLPIVTQTGVRIRFLITGALFIESVFSYPGVGYLLYNSLSMRDYPVLQGIFLIVTMLVLFSNFTIDLLYKKIDPRIG